MDILATKFIASLLLPPLNAILPLLLGWWWLKRRPRLANWLIGGGLLLFAIPSLPLTADWLCLQLEPHPAPDIEQLDSTNADAIVVLAGGWRRAPEYGGDATVNQLSLQRLTHGVRLHRDTGLPLALTGGRVYGNEEQAEAELMAQVLRHEFGLEPRWVETNSRNTAENAGNTAKLLRSDGVEKIVLVTHAFHMGRALPEFERHDLEVIAAPMAYCAGDRLKVNGKQFIPSTKSYSRSYLAMHELLGQAWYGVKSVLSAN